VAVRRRKLGRRGPQQLMRAGRALPPPHLTGSRSRPVAGWEPPGGGSVLGAAINRNLAIGVFAGSTWNASTAHGTQHGAHRSGGYPSPQRFVRMTTQGGANTVENIAPTASTIRIARRALSRNRGRPGK
jgi:hypothetical protein